MVAEPGAPSPEPRSIRPGRCGVTFAGRTPSSEVMDHIDSHGWGTAFAGGAGFAALALLVASAVVRFHADEINPAHVH
jgi:hypothetical protein